MRRALLTLVVCAIAAGVSLPAPAEESATRMSATDLSRIEALPQVGSLGSDRGTIRTSAADAGFMAYHVYAHRRANRIRAARRRHMNEVRADRRLRTNEIRASRRHRTNEIRAYRRHRANVIREQRY